MEKAKEKKVLGIIALIIAIFALILSWVPIINNIAAIFAVLGIILGVIALVINRKNKKTIALIATILSVLSIIVVLATQGLYSKAIDDATGKSDKNVTSTASSTASSEKKDDTTKKTFKLSETVKQQNGLEIKVNNVKFTQGTEYTTPKAGTQFILVNVTLKNTGNKSVSYNPYDFKLDDNGNQTDMNSYAGSDEQGNPVVSDDLHSGTLQPNATVSGTLVGEGNPENDIKLASVDYDGEINWTINLK